MKKKETTYECPNFEICDERIASASCSAIRLPIAANDATSIVYLRYIADSLYQMQQCLQSIVLLLEQNNLSSSND